MLKKSGFQKNFILLSLVSVGVLINFPTPISDDRFMSVNFWATGLVFIWVSLIYYFSNKLNLRVSIYDGLVGSILSAIYVVIMILGVGQTGDNLNGVNFVGKYYLTGSLNMFLTIWCFFGWAVLITYTSSLLSYWVETTQIKIGNVPSKKKIAMLLSIAWVLVLVCYFPGQASWDAMRQFCEFERTKLAHFGFQYVPTNHQPWFTTLIFGSLFSMGRLISVNFGILLVVLVQFVFSNLVYTCAIQYVWKKMGDLPGKLTLLLFASPVFSTYVITIDKSSLSYSLGVAFFLCYLKVLESIKTNQLNWQPVFRLLSTSFFFAQFRNDSKYVVIFSYLVLIAFVCLRKASRKKIVTSGIVLLLLLVGWSQYLKFNQVVSGSASEALTIPARQLSYVYLHDQDSFSKEELQKINKVTELKKIRKAYNLNQADNLKNLFPVNTFLNNNQMITDVVNKKKDLIATPQDEKAIKEYEKVWLVKGVQHPLSYLAVYLGANTRYLNPVFGLNGASASLFLDYHPEYPKFIRPSWNKQFKPVVPEKIRRAVNQLMTAIVALPPLALFINCGFALWGMIWAIGMILKKRQWLLLTASLPIILMIGMYTLTPVNGYSRYTLGVTAILPVYFAYCWSKIRFNVTKKVGEK
ncbi:DUF6020 family protein [Limosilactobacillus ingluviei]|uniref:DUF6020 family protein n=1 Tax=Limosilactobacillus ingluviei TaxID=148604 RepID=UPI0023F29832|nr:DUF6020 family protein [Limosilactobacillus ingluviei]